MNITIRPIIKEDNAKTAKMIREVLIEMGVPKVGTAYEDQALDCMFETYDQPRSAYFVVVQGDEILGGAGIAPLAKAKSTICELQKMYFLSRVRGAGWGSQMMERCIAYGKEQGYTQCYLETLPYMEAARKLYARTGFQSLDKAMGDTGHYNCSMWMLKDLD